MVGRNEVNGAKFYVLWNFRKLITKFENKISQLEISDKQRLFVIFFTILATESVNIKYEKHLQKEC